MIGIVLVVVGFVLFHNAWFGLFGKVKDETAGKTLSVVNFLGGAAIIAMSLLVMSQGEYGEGYFSAMIYLVVGLTYIYIGFDHLFGLDPKAFGVFCLTGAIALAIGGVGVIEGGIDSGWDVWLLLMWFSWAILWFILFLECAFEKKFGNITAIICLLTTFYTGWIPGIMLLMGWWG
jgi:hypothetical protein